ncbi:hypothetical protein M0802_014147 [Mischocyttarus mexicanus]|nr:hypothetical protein M0802_014147 [Mischocyttarus mexicanus]
MHSDRPGPVQYYLNQKPNIDTSFDLASVQISFTSDVLLLLFRTTDALFFRRFIRKCNTYFLQYSDNLEKSRRPRMKKKILEADVELANLDDADVMFLLLMMMMMMMKQR